MVSEYKTDWDLKLLSTVHPYNTSKKSTTGKSPFFLVLGQEAVHGIELEMETYKVIAFRNSIQTGDPEI